MMTDVPQEDRTVRHIGKFARPPSAVRRSWEPTRHRNGCRGYHRAVIGASRGCSQRSPCSVGGGYPPTGAASEKLPASRSHRVRGQRAFPETPGDRKEDSGAGRFRSLRGTQVVGSQPRGLQNSCPESMRTTRMIVQNVDSDQSAGRHSHCYQDLEV